MEFNILFPVDLTYKKIAILWEVKNLDQWVDKNEIYNKLIFRSFDEKTILFKKTLGQK